MADEIRLSFLVAYEHGLPSGASEDTGAGGYYPGLAAFNTALGNGQITTIQTYMPELISLYPTIIPEDSIYLGWLLSGVSTSAPAFSGEFVTPSTSAFGTVLQHFLTIQGNPWSEYDDAHRALGTLLERIFWLPLTSPRIIGLFRYTPVQLTYGGVPHVLEFGGPHNGGGSKGGMS
jgi:hypothetical protein